MGDGRSCGLSAACLAVPHCQSALRTERASPVGWRASSPESLRPYPLAHLLVVPARSPAVALCTQCSIPCRSPGSWRCYVIGGAFCALHSERVTRRSCSTTTTIHPLPVRAHDPSLESPASFTGTFIATATGSGAAFASRKEPPTRGLLLPVRERATTGMPA